MWFKSLFGNKAEGDVASAGKKGKKETKAKKQLRVGIIGAGKIAETMAKTLAGMDDACCYAIASRSLEKAEAFAKKWNVTKAYGSYEEMLEDEAVELVYVATPHSHHFAHAMMCVEAKKPVLVEKAFTANRKQAEKLLAAAEENGVLVTEAIWTRYMPSRDILREVLASGEIGEVKEMDAEFSIPLTGKERMIRPELCGGALLDLGMYALTTASIYFGDDVVDMQTSCLHYDTGVDGEDEMEFTYRDGKVAHLRTSMLNRTVNHCEIRGTKGSLVFEELNNPRDARIVDASGALVRKVELPAQITGYEYEVRACARELAAGGLECEEMTHEMTLDMMGLMDKLRKAWGYNAF